MHRFRCLVFLLVAAAQLVAAGGCATRSSSAAGWRALQPGVDVRLDEGCGPDGASVLSVLYTVVPGRSYAIEHSTPAGMAQTEVHLTLRATRVLHLAVVIVDEAGLEHEAARTLAPGDWRELRFDEFCPPLQDGADVEAMRIVDRTGALGGQGPVSLRIAGLPVDR